MLAQYRNIEHLLGPTDDWTAPGTHCEVLLRDLIRRYLPSAYRADKGFIFGRRPDGGDTKHCPEVDILIHDTGYSRPLIQVEDFVIVRANSSRGAIQVKRRMDTDALRNALNNVVDARFHYNCMRGPAGFGSRFFSAAIFFDEKQPRTDGHASASYRNCIQTKFSDTSAWHLAPDVIGSLQQHIFYRDQYGHDRLRYVGCPAIWEGRNIGVQILLWKLAQMLGMDSGGMPFAFPQIPQESVTCIEMTPAGTGGGQVPPTSSEQPARENQE